ncbi:DNA cytosine methyltransferase [Laspinema olomoucense]|uniref:DNA cytosine methyltransferase n=1 Tax=Laspinema olomoucense TaxID=3231600 RepID=UPI0021BB5EAE|nr:DNA cytosine methyltransferase [Laspinema sp. D3c]MCT7992484.1 DNA cytosine methyltransferase [Laspinema sp. D3c]
MENQIKAISLFSGIGAFEYAATQFVFGDDWNTIQFVEIEPTAQKVLQSQFPGIPIHGDIRTYHPPIMRSPSSGGGESGGESGEESGGESVQDYASVIIGGFPCTNTSCAGSREGLAGDESGLWYSMLRVIREAQPDFVIIENPEGLVHRGLREVLAGLRMAGYQTEVEMFSAQEFGAPHRRLRLFILAYADRLAIQQRKGWTGWDEQIGSDIEKTREIGALPQTESTVLPMDARIFPYLAGLSYSGWWKHNSPPVNIGLPLRTPGRRAAINLVGQSIAIPQAVCVLLRLKFLCSLLD